MGDKTVRLNLELSKKLNRRLEDLAKKTGGSKSDVLRRAIALMEIAVYAKETGKKLGVVDPDQYLEMEIVGI